MKRLVYIFAIVIIAIISFSCCHRKAITQAEIDEINQKINTELAQLNKNNEDSICIAVSDSSTTDSIATINSNENSKISNISINQQPANNEGFWITLIVSIAIIVPFASLVIIILFAIKAITKHKHEHNELIAKAIESNYSLPDNFFVKPQTTRTRLQSALVWSACGIGTIVFFLLISDDALYAIGLIPLLIGIAKLITYIIEDHKN